MNQNVSSKINMYFAFCESINSIENKYSIIFPNPTSNTLNIKDVEFNSNLSVFSIDGKVVFQKQIKTENEIDISHLDNGIYFLRIEKNGKISTQKFIKQ